MAGLGSACLNSACGGFTVKCLQKDITHHLIVGKRHVLRVIKRRIAKIAG